MLPPNPIFLIAAGALTGALGAVLGIGGGVFLVPALTLFFEIPIHHAAGAGLVAVVATSCAAAAVNLEKGLVNAELGMLLESATVSGAIAGVLAATVLPGTVLLAAFAVTLAGVTILLARRPLGNPMAPSDQGLFPAEYNDPALGGKVRYAVRRIGVALFASFSAGGLSGLLGIGGGVLKVPALHLFCGVPIKAAAATSTFTIGVTAAAGAILFLIQGNADHALNAAVALGALLGSGVGARLSGHLPPDGIRRAFAILTAVLSILMARRALGF